MDRTQARIQLEGNPVFTDLRMRHDVLLEALKRIIHDDTRARSIALDALEAIGELK